MVVVRLFLSFSVFQGAVFTALSSLASFLGILCFASSDLVVLTMVSVVHTDVSAYRQLLQLW